MNRSTSTLPRPSPERCSRSLLASSPRTAQESSSNRYARLVYLSLGRSLANETHSLLTSQRCTTSTSTSSSPRNPCSPSSLDSHHPLLLPTATHLNLQQHQPLIFVRRMRSSTIRKPARPRSRLRSGVSRTACSPCWPPWVRSAGLCRVQERWMEHMSHSRLAALPCCRLDPSDPVTEGQRGRDGCS